MRDHSDSVNSVQDTVPQAPQPPVSVSVSVVQVSASVVEVSASVVQVSVVVSALLVSAVTAQPMVEHAHWAPVLRRSTSVPVVNRCNLVFFPPKKRKFSKKPNYEPSKFLFLKKYQTSITQHPTK
jgi:hypothetical protein